MNIVVNTMKLNKKIRKVISEIWICFSTSRRFRPIITAKPEAATGNPWPICP